MRVRSVRPIRGGKRYRTRVKSFWMNRSKDFDNHMWSSHIYAKISIRKSRNFCIFKYMADFNSWKKSNEKKSNLSFFYFSLFNNWNRPRVKTKFFSWNSHIYETIFRASFLLKVKTNFFQHLSENLCMPSCSARLPLQTIQKSANLNVGISRYDIDVFCL